MNIVLFYNRDDRWFPLSNFYKLKDGLDIGSEHFLSTEQYFQVMKFRGKNATPRMLEYSMLIKEADGPAKAKMLGAQRKDLRFGKKWMLNKKTDHRLVNDLIDEYKDLKIRSDWHYVSTVVMLVALTNKFMQYPELYKLLTDVPDNTYFVEHTVRDRVWGDGGDRGSGVIGENRLGKLLTAISYVLKPDRS